MDGIEHGIRARKFWSERSQGERWQGESFMAAGQREVVLGGPVMEEM
jgi:hypothetical protein